MWIFSRIPWLCQYSQLHTNAFLTSTNTITTITLLQDSNQHDKGLALCLRVILDSGAHMWVLPGHPRYTGARKGRPWVAHTRRLPPDDQIDTDKRQDKRAFSETGVDCTSQVLTHTRGILQVGQQIQQISELQFDKFPDPQSFLVWKIRLKNQVTTCVGIQSLTPVFSACSPQTIISPLHNPQQELAL